MRAAVWSMLCALLLVGGCWDFPQERYYQDGRTPDGPSTDGPRADGPRPDGPRADGPGIDAPRTDGPNTDLPLTDQGLVLGSSCTSPGQCASNKCVEGFCCDDPCTDKCKSCALSASPGKCTQMPTGSVCGPGTCKENNTVLSGHMVCESPDAGAMTCVKATTDQKCSPFACNATAGLCYSTCESKNEDTNCPGYYACDTSKAVCYSSCQNKHQCKATGTCIKPNCVKN